VGRVVLVHGFTQTGASWRRIAEALRADGHDVVTPDLPGHGGTPPADLAAAAERLAATCDAAERPATWVGYSMGGRACLHLALAHPAAVQRLVLLGATAGIDDEGERNARRHSDELLATRLEALGVERFIDEWLAQPMFEGVPADADGTAERRTNTVDGLAGALRLAGTGAQEPLWDRLAELGVVGIPTVVLAGELDGKFKVLARRLADAIGPTATVEWVPGAGHAAHLERPDEFVTILRRHLAEPQPDHQ
jgi:2-succinyl-6-hydroxy-2,4-cyclohexadiene-1-carboxylate synthase